MVSRLRQYETKVIARDEQIQSKTNDQLQIQGSEQLSVIGSTGPRDRAISCSIIVHSTSGQQFKLLSPVSFLQLPSSSRYLLRKLVCNLTELHGRKAGLVVVISYTTLSAIFPRSKHAMNHYAAYTQYVLAAEFVLQLQRSL